MSRAIPIAVVVALAACASTPPGPASPPARPLTLVGPAELVEPGLVSTPITEVRITFSPDGQRMLWGVIGFTGGPGGWEIVESRRTAAGWTAPEPVAFDGPANDFDPSFAPDGSGVLFFSNRPGGRGGDDLYFAPLDATTGWGEAVNLGAAVNSAGDEWAPVLSPDGRTLVFATDGRGGAGRHDLFASARAADGQLGLPVALEALNGPDEDFDATFLHGGDVLVFSRGRFDGGAPVALHWAPHTATGWGAPARLGPEVNEGGADALTNGPSIAPSAPGWLYFSTHRPGGAGRMDIWRVRYAR